MDERAREFLRDNHAGIIVSVRKDGSPHVARVTVAYFDDKVWTSGTQTRVRTKHLRANPHAAITVLKQDDNWNWLGIEGKVTVHELPEALDKLLQIRRLTGRDPEDLEAFRRTMYEEQRLVFEMTPERTYGNLG
jgi:PPOX class probable F420-dependent enzyme